MSRPLRRLGVFRRPDCRFDPLRHFSLVGMPSKALLDGAMCNCTGTRYGHIGALRDRRKQSVSVTSGRRGQVTNGCRCRGEHAVRYCPRSNRDRSKAHARKDVEVVYLGDVMGDVADCHRVEGAAGADQGAAVGPRQNVSRDGLCTWRWVGQREHNRPLNATSLGTNHLLGEQTRLAGHTNERMRCDVAHDFEQVDLTIVVVVPSFDLTPWADERCLEWQ